MSDILARSAADLVLRQFLVAQCMRFGMDKAEAESMPNSWLTSYCFEAAFRHDERVIQWIKGE